MHFDVARIIVLAKLANHTNICHASGGPPPPPPPHQTVYDWNKQFPPPTILIVSRKTVPLDHWYLSPLKQKITSQFSVWSINNQL